MGNVVTDEYISRAEALRAVQKQRGANRSPAQNAMLDRICCDIKNMTAADVAPVGHGKWASEAKGGVYGPVCSVCGYYIPGISFWNAPYCPKCGARMDGAAE